MTVTVEHGPRCTSLIKSSGYCLSCEALWGATNKLVDALKVAVHIIEAEHPGKWEQGRKALEEAGQ